MNPKQWRAAFIILLSAFFICLLCGILELGAIVAGFIFLVPLFLLYFWLDERCQYCGDKINPGRSLKTEQGGFSHYLCYAQNKDDNSPDL